MAMTPEQVKGRIKSLAKKNNADARVLIRIYMMERFLERVSTSIYAENFIIKGGVLVTSMVGVAMRTTMDIDTTIRNINLSEETVRRMVEEISAIDLNDGVSFRIKDIGKIMDDMEYPGIRVAMDAIMGQMITPVKVDVSTGDAITPRAVEYSYPLMIENRAIKLWSYNIETVLAEKLQTVMARGILNTRMRDYYDIYMLLTGFKESIDASVLSKAFVTTCNKRETLNLYPNASSIISSVEMDENLQKLWASYQKKFAYASDISFEAVIRSMKELLEMIAI